MKHETYYLLFIVILVISCSGSKPSKNTTEEETTESTEIFIQEEAEIEPQNEKEELTKQQLLSKFLIDHEFENAKNFIQTKAINLNDFLETDKGRTWVKGSRILADIIAYSCDAEITKFLLAQDINPNLPSITVFIPEYSGEEIPEDFDIKKDDLSFYRNQDYLIEDYPLQNSLNCNDSTSFYLLINAGANQDNFILQGAIKWSDTLLIKKSIAKEVAVDFVPGTNDVEILKLLVPITDGKQYGEIGYGEGGDMFDTDLMNACRAGEKELVWFMLETGSDPNGCLPTNYDKEGNYINPDENGFLPAQTALSNAREKYKSNIDLSKNRENSFTFVEKAQDFEEIITLLKKYGAKEIDKCLGP